MKTPKAAPSQTSNQTSKASSKNTKLQPLPNQIQTTQSRFRTGTANTTLKENKSLAPQEGLLVSPLEITSQIDFNYCPVGEVAKLTITAKNHRRAPTDFVWLYAEPFSVEPHHGTINGKAEQEFIISFYPKTAAPYSGRICIRFGKDLLETRDIEVSGVAKVPHISLSTGFIDFGRVPSGSKATQSITLHNSAPVPATVDIKSDFGLFNINPKVVSLKPQGSETITISFHPTNFDFYAFGNISFTTAGGNSATLRASAYVTGSKVTVDHSYLNCGNIQLKYTGSNIFNIKNHSNRRVIFQFLIEPTSVFKFEPSQGILAPKYEQAIRVTFIPEYPIAYHRRVILLLHQHHPIAIDVYGSAYDTFNHPPRLKPSFIEANHRIAADGLMSKPPHLLAKITDPQLPTVDFITADLKRNPCTIQSGAQLFDELFVSQDLVTLSSNHFEFGQMQRDVSPDPQTLTVKNNTDSPITLYWGTNSDGFIEVKPAISEIPRKQTADIQLIFHPKLEFQFMGAILEGFAQYKEMRNANIVEFPTLPFLLAPFCDGHTMDDVTSFIPTLHTSHKLLIFSGAIVGDSNYQTFVCENRGDCAFKYDISIIEAEYPDRGSVSSSSAAFSVYPQTGTINKGSFQIFVVKFSPTQRGHFHAQIFATINDSPTNNFVVNVKGDAAVPGVSFSVSGTMFLHPVSMGSISGQTMKISNDSTVPVRLEWKIPSIYANHLIVKPQTAEIKAREVIDCLWEFHPTVVGEFRVEVLCNVQALSGSSHSYIAREMLPYVVGTSCVSIDQSVLSSLKSVQHYPLTVCTLVTECTVNSQPESIDFGFVRINSAASSSLSISNHSDSQMHFLLQPKSGGKTVQFVPADDVLPPRSSREVEVRFVPPTPGYIEDTILCSLLNETIFQENHGQKSLSDLVVKKSASEICRVSGIGCFPHLSITDVFAPKYSRETMWEHNSINAINSELSILGCDSLTDELKEFTIDFGEDVVGAEPTSIYLTFRNSGHIAFSFSINFPNDISIDPEYWAMPDEIDPNQLKQDQIMQAKLFKISEKKFSLEPHAETTVCFSYSHKYMETHELPVHLTVQNGRIIRLKLHGTTLDPSVPHIISDSTVFDLQPVPIGCLEPPIQRLRVFNPAECDAEYRIDLTQIQEINETNHDFEIFKCLNSTGTVKSRQEYFIEWVFKPLEAKDYEVSLLCIISNGNSFTVQLRGRGVHTGHEECSVQWPIFPPKSLTIQNVSPVTLSEQMLDFGDIPVFIHTERVIFMANNSKREFDYEAQQITDVIHIEPRKGTLGPNQKIPITISVDSPDVPTILKLALPILFTPKNEASFSGEEDISEVNFSGYQSLTNSTVDNESEQSNLNSEELEEQERMRREREENPETKEELYVCDPPMEEDVKGKRARLKKMQERNENWKSVGERSLEASEKTKNHNSRLFSTHIGKRATDESKMHLQRNKNSFTQFLDIVINALGKRDYRARYGAMDGFFFSVEQNHDKPGDQHKDEIAEIVTEIVDEALADPQVRRIALEEAKIRHEAIPYFSQLYKSEPVVPEGKANLTPLRQIDEIERILREILNEVIMEGESGQFNLDKDIIYVSGFKPKN